MKRSRLAIALSTSSLLLASCSFSQSVLAPNLAQEQPVVAQTGSPSQALLSARQIAWEASLLVQRPPHPAPTWQQAKVKWRQAIRLLEKIPADTPVSSQAQQRLTVYRTNYDAVSQRLALEEKGLDSFDRAQTAAWQAAVTVQTPPHPLKVWQRAEEKWQESIALLESIPPMTAVSAPAKVKLIAYRHNQRAIKQRIQTEIKAQAVLQQFSEMADRLYSLQMQVINGRSIEPLGINYEKYRQWVQPLRKSVTELNQQPEGKYHPIYQELADAIADYEFVSDIWQAYLDVKQENSWYLQEDDLFNQLIPLAKIDSTTLLSKYDVKLYRGAKQPKVPLKFTAWAIWEHAGKRINAAQKKLADLH